MKILKILLSIVFLFLILRPQTANAATCQLTTTPSPVTTNDRTINIDIKTTGLVEGNEYWVGLNGILIRNFGLGREVGNNFKLTNGLISVRNVNNEGSVNHPSSNTSTFQAKSYKVSVQETKFNGTSFCSDFFSVQQASKGGSCQIGFLNTSFTNNDGVSIKVSNLSGNPSEGRQVVVKRNNESGSEVKSFCNNVSQLSDPGIVLGKFETGNYYLEIRDSCLPFFSRLCFVSFPIGEPGTTSGGPIPVPSPFCQGGICKTALGDIETNPAGFITKIFGIILSLAGGIALILIIVSGYRLMVSQGNPEKVQAAREQLTSAIVGLLFVIFSIAILTIIGVDILRLPGFRP